MYPQAGGQAPQGRPQEPWQQGGTYYGSHSTGYGNTSPEPGPQGHSYGNASPEPGPQGHSYGNAYPADPHQQQTSDPYRQQASGYPPQPPGSYPQQTPPAPFGQASAGVPPKKKSKAPLIVGLVIGGLLLCCGGGGALLWVVGDTADQTMDDIVASAFPSSTPSGEDTELDGDLDDYKTGDCLTISANDDINAASCSKAGAFKVVLRKDGTISETACKNTDYSEYLYQEGRLGASDGIVLCIAPAKG